MKKLENKKTISFDTALSQQHLVNFLMKQFGDATAQEISQNLSKYGIQKLIEIAQTLQILTVESICEQIYSFIQKKKLQQVFITPTKSINVKQFIDNYSESQQKQLKIAMKFWDDKILLKFAKKLQIKNENCNKQELVESEVNKNQLIEQILNKLQETYYQKINQTSKISKEQFVAKYSNKLWKEQSIDKLFQLSSQDGPGFVYVIYEKKIDEKPLDNFNIFEYKVGMTQFLPDRRITIMEKTNSQQYIVKQSFETSYRKLLEKIVHSELSDYHIAKEEKLNNHKDGKTEWFKIDFITIKSIILNCKQAISKVYY